LVVLDKDQILLKLIIEKNKIIEKVERNKHEKKISQRILNLFLFKSICDVIVEQPLDVFFSIKPIFVYEVL